MHKSKNPYWDEATKVANRQRVKGIAEYGQGLEDNKELTLEERIEYAIEEAIDLVYYLEHLKAGLNELLKEIRHENT